MIDIKDDVDKILLETILKYIVLPINKNNSKTKKKQSRLEELIQKDKLKSSKSVLENIIEFLKEKDSKKIKKTEFIELPKGKLEKLSDEEEIKYSMAMERKNKNKDISGYKVSITYEETEVEERLSVKVTFDDNYPLNIDSIKNNNDKNNYNQKSKNNKKLKNNENDYSINIKKKKKNKTKDNYSINLAYENNYDKERLNVSYKSTLGAYLNKRQDALHNFEDRVPGKHVDVFPASAMPGVLGFTYLGQDRMALRDDLSGNTKKMVDIHESIHTPDEYETRILTDWIMSKPKMKYFK